MCASLPLARSCAARTLSRKQSPSSASDLCEPRWLVAACVLSSHVPTAGGRVEGRGSRSVRPPLLALFTTPALWQHVRGHRVTSVHVSCARVTMLANLISKRMFTAVYMAYESMHLGVVKFFFCYRYKRFAFEAETAPCFRFQRFLILFRVLFPPNNSLSGE